MVMPIDHFMSELAEDAGENAVGIVLSGTAHDGTAGLKAIRAGGGLTLVQSPETAEFPGMPDSAITSGVADQVLAAQDMPAALCDFLRHRPQDLPPSGPGPVTLPQGEAADPERADESLLHVLRLLQACTGHDFRWYRPAMLRRRLRRRMVLRKLDHVEDYIRFLEGSRDELEALKNEFLISVTDFFRDPSTWAELAQAVIPELVAQHVHDDAPIRVWTPGCATGEESYSIAMLLLEQAEGKIDPRRIQVFGTDIDLHALSVARAGAYPASIVATVSAPRLARFFDRQGERYVARKTLRDTLLFAPQDVVRDTPFSKLDLVVCRNVLIYFQPALQQHVLELFHFALKPGGLLLLGKAESIGSQTELFAPASRSIRLFRRTGAAAHLPPGFGSSQGAILDDHAPKMQRLPPGSTAADRAHTGLNGAAPSNEELRTANEESLALNEELQSSNEELQSSKEELESLNEELTTSSALLDEKVNELALRNDELANLLANAGMAMILLDASLCIRRFTPAASEVFSLKAGDEGRLLSDISSRVDDPPFAADLGRVTESGQGSFAEVHATTGKTYLRRVQAYRTQAGKVDGAVVTFADVTALREASQRVRELVTMLQDSSDAIIIRDGEGTILAWNDGAQRIYGHTRDSVMGTSFYALVPPSERRAAQDLAAGVLASGKSSTRDCLRICLDGTTISVSATLSALRDLSGGIYALVSTERDISQQLRSESEMYFRRLADRIPVLLRVEDAEGLAQFVNHPCTVFTGRPRESLLGDGWLQFVHPQDRDRYIDEHAHALAQRARLEIDLRMRRADGAFRWMRSISVPHFSARDEFVGYVGLMLDVEDHKLAESALREADRRKDEFLAMLAHELRNPLAPIRNAAMVIARSSTTDPRTTWAVNVIGRQTELLAKLLDDLLDVARIARGKVVLEKAPVELAVLVQRAVEICQPLIDLRGHRLSVTGPEAPLVVEGDLTRLTQVLANLLTNSAKYMDEGGQIWLDISRQGESAVIQVRDAGMGMAAEVVAHVFEPFTQADSSLERSRGGLGLGLTLVKQLVDLHGGSVEARSAGLGQGSEFTVRLPLLQVAAPAVPKAPSDEQPVSNASCRVLVVDDNRDAAETLAMLLRSVGHEVTLAFDGNEALVAAERSHPQVVVLDVGLPGLDGYEVARRLRGASATAHVKLIALTGYGQPEDVARAHAAGFDHHFVKPVDPAALLGLVHS